MPAELLLSPGSTPAPLGLGPFCPLVVLSLPLPLFTHTVHRPVMENADKLTGRRIQAVMREGSQGGGGVGGRTRGRWERGGRPSCLKILHQNHQRPRPGGEREVKVQGPVSGCGQCGEKVASTGFTASTFGSEPAPERGHLVASAVGVHVPPACHRCAQTLMPGRNVWGGCPVSKPEEPGRGRGCSQGSPGGPRQGEPAGGCGPRRSGGRAQATT